MTTEARVEEIQLLKLSEIEKGLSALWQKATGQLPGAPELPEIRVCTLSLIVNIPDDLSQKRACTAVNSATAEHPLRAIFMRAEPDAPASTTEGQVSGICQVTETGGVRICSEQILVTAKGKAVNELAASVSNLLIPDVPVALWWMGEPGFSQSIFEHLELISDYLIVDSMDFADTLEDLRRMVMNVNRHPQVTPSDLNWLRITAWRESVADLFDKPKHLACLDQISSLQIEYASGDNLNPSQAILLAGWLEGRLKWSLSVSSKSDSPGHYKSIAKSAGCNEIRISITPIAADDSKSGTLSKVRIETTGGEEVFSLNYTSGVIRSTATAGGLLEEKFENQWQPESMVVEEILSDELESLWPDPIYTESLRIGTELIGG